MKFTDTEIDAVHRIFHDFAARMIFALESNIITEDQYEAYEVLYDKLVWVMKGREIQ